MNHLQHSASALHCCNTLQHTHMHPTATHCTALPHAATRCITRTHPTATHCTTLHHAATHCNTLQHTAPLCNTLCHNATHCNTQVTHTHPTFAETCCPPLITNLEIPFCQPHVVTPQQEIPSAYCSVLQRLAARCCSVSKSRQFVTHE